MIRCFSITAFMYCILFSGTVSQAQEFQLSTIYPASDISGNSIYSIHIRNTSRDSIMVLHTQEAQFPPFINKYKFELLSKKDSGVVVYLGKSNNPLLPEKYRATKTLPAKGEVDLYFSLPSGFNGKVKQVNIYYSMLADKYYSDFQLLESTGTNAAIKRCKELKEKHGVVHQRKVLFK